MHGIPLGGFPVAGGRSKPPNALDHDFSQHDDVCMVGSCEKKDIVLKETWEKVKQHQISQTSLLLMEEIRLTS